MNFDMESTDANQSAVSIRRLTLPFWPTVVGFASVFITSISFGISIMTHFGEVQMGIAEVRADIRVIDTRLSAVDENTRSIRQHERDIERLKAIMENDPQPNMGEQ